MSGANRMTKGERTELLSLVRKREKVLKTMAQERSAQMLAEFEAQAAKIYSFDEDAVWNEAAEQAKRAVDVAKKEIEDRCRALGIPSEFAPTLDISWSGRGQNALQWRMAELRRAAKKRIEAVEAEAVTKIEQMTLEAQTAILAQGLDTDAAHTFLQATKDEMARLMPSITVVEVEKMMAPTLRRRAIDYN